MSQKGRKSHTNRPHGSPSEEVDVSDIVNVNTHHEEGDVNATPVYKFLIWLAVSVALTYVLVYGMMKWNDRRAERMDAEFTHVAKLQNEHLPPEPRLQLAPGHMEHPLDDGKHYRDSLQISLNSYGYINKAAGQVHLPIEVAKQIALSRGFPSRANGASTVEAIMSPSFTSGGRMLRPRDQRIPHEDPMTPAKSE